MIKLEEHKQATEHKAVEKIPVSERVWIPLVQHLGKPCLALVKTGDQVLLGQKIASVDAHVSATIHASVSGKVSGISDYPHPVLGRSKAICIENNGRDEPAYKGTFPRTGIDPDDLSPDELRKIIAEAGIVGLGGAGFPTHVKLNPPKSVTELIINAAECEPYLTADFRLMVERTEEIIKGVDLVARCLGVKKVYIAIEDNKPDAAGRLAVFGSRFSVKVLKTAYPQGGEKQLIKNVLDKEVPQGKLPFEVGVVVQNIATVLAIFEAVYYGKPLYERVITVTGSCVRNPKNLLVRLGTPISELIDFCGLLQEEPAKIIIGGPMMGISQYTTDVPVIKTTTGIILMSKEETPLTQETTCIRCGACVRSCPVGLMPCMINLVSQRQLWPQAKSYGALDCIECGCCNYVCPADRNITQSIKRAKLEVSQ